MSARKEIAKDLRVIAAIEALKSAVLSVNGDKEVVSTLVLVDVKTADGNGIVAQRFDVCPCPTCVARIRKMLSMGMAEVQLDQDRQIRKRQAH